MTKCFRDCLRNRDRRLGGCGVEEFEGLRDNFGVNRYTYYNDYGHGYADAYVSKLITLCILICAIYYMSVIPQ